MDIARRDQGNDFRNPHDAFRNALDTVRARREQRELASRNIASRVVYKMTAQTRHWLHR